MLKNVPLLMCAFRRIFLFGVTYVTNVKSGEVTNASEQLEKPSPQSPPDNNSRGNVGTIRGKRIICHDEAINCKYMKKNERLSDN